MATYYTLLGINKSASPDEVRRAYKLKALETHPDKFLYPGASDRAKRAAEARFHRVHEAFETLNDPQKRSSYDARLNPKPNNNNAKQKRELSEEQQKREKDRKEWARKLDEKHRERMRALKEQSRMAQQLITQKPKPIVIVDHQAMVDDMLKELYQRNPEWEARMKKAQRLKAERARAKGIRPIRSP